MILRTSTRDVHTDQQRAFALSDMIPYGWDSRADPTGSTLVGTKEAYGLPAFYRAVRFFAETLAKFRLYAWTGEADQRRRADGTKQGRLFKQIPNPIQSRFDFWETIGESLIVPRNAYIWKNFDPVTGRVIEWWALNPLQVTPRVEKAGNIRFRVTVAGSWVDPVGRGEATYDVGPDVILHIKGCAGNGQIASSLIDQYRTALAADIARLQHEATSFGKSAKLEYAILFPQGLAKQQAEEWRRSYTQTYGGPGGEKTLILGSGADVKPIGMTNEDAELVALSHMSVERAAHMVGVPISMLGVTGSNADSTPMEQKLEEWLTFGIGPMFSRIEAALEADSQIFTSPGGPVYPAFQTDGFVRGDMMTEDTIAHNQVQDGRLLVDEWREPRGYPPLPNGAGKVPQVVPVGGGANPGGPPPPPANQPKQTEPNPKKEGQ